MDCKRGVTHAWWTGRRGTWLDYCNRGVCHACMTERMAVAVLLRRGAEVASGRKTKNRKKIEQEESAA